MPARVESKKNLNDIYVKLSVASVVAFIDFAVALIGTVFFKVSVTFGEVSILETFNLLTRFSGFWGLSKLLIIADKAMLNVAGLAGLSGSRV